jgi:hypothetical protein
VRLATRLGIDFPRQATKPQDATPADTIPDAKAEPQPDKTDPV